ncbi:uracil-DNA glycosylase [Gordonia rubripertincta]|uniref:Type-5 uracil-DNA glycosylase n=2 Tax=Gordonia rubripertincta TaxID=36822 RepID=A0AAW6R9M4_GORRU|nr:uracil-DNA glycosylase [Gordonia rubripertincta]MDG6780868.1 uracil-DNA glycosylase [Gordonia rubripertincta]NKY63305.1 uracil-DNA glycosylase [Gordonia rubripertincta]GAB86182.1 putative uracil-DNA glycosylase [Gordonia rubripertincta NBRC 101908]
MAPRQRFRNLAELDAQLIDCRACPRLVEWREQVAREKRRAFADQEYWGRPVPGIGPADARLLIVGLAPAAHGGNRTGRMFTGDQSGDFLFSAMYLAGLVSQPHSVSMDDGLELFGTRITAPVHCAPPQNKPTVEERDRCSRWLHGELELLAPTARSVITLGAFGWQSTLRTFGALGWTVPRPAPKFGHGASTILTRDDATLEVFGCYHVSQHNTFTGRLTVEMLVDVLKAAAESAGILPGE